MDERQLLYPLYYKFLMWLFTFFNKYRMHNSINLLKRKGTLITSNGFKLKFNKYNKKDIKNLYMFNNIYGVLFSGSLSENDGFWHYRDNIIETPEGIKLYANTFYPLVFAETYLYDIHFIDFYFENKVIVQAGGFIGDTALYYALRGAVVYSFEPEINSFHKALENLGLNPDLSNRIVIKNYAIGNDSEIEFPIDVKVSGKASALNVDEKKTVKTRSVSLKTILNEFNISDPYLLDLDIKGKELDIIEDNNVKKFEVVRIEYAYSPIKNNVDLSKKNEIIKKLKDYGFKNFRIFKHNELIYDLNEHGTIIAKKS